MVIYWKSRIKSWITFSGIIFWEICKAVTKCDSKLNNEYLSLPNFPLPSKYESFNSDQSATTSAISINKMSHIKNVCHSQNDQPQKCKKYVTWWSTAKPIPCQGMVTPHRHTQSTLKIKKNAMTNGFRYHYWHFNFF